MSSPSLIGAAIAIFVIAALLYLQSVSEGFVNPGVQAMRNQMDGVPEASDVPADLNQAPISKPVSVIPPVTGPKPDTIPGSITPTPKKALATKNELAELDNKLMTWLDAASQREVMDPMALSAEQREKRVLYQARSSAVRQQLGTGIVTDASVDVADQIMTLRNENAGWQGFPGYVDTTAFQPTGSPTSILTTADYRTFRGIMFAALTSLKANALSNPLDLVRQKQLEQIDQELRVTDQQGRTPLIRNGVAQAFLRVMLDSAQPLPSLITMDGLYPR
jgi:hypothetical protein